MRSAGVREPRLVDPERVAAAKDHRSLDDVLQLANIARPVVGLAQLQGLLVDLPDVFSSLGRIAPHVVLDEQRNIALAGAALWSAPSRATESTPPASKAGVSTGCSLAARSCSVATPVA